MLEKQTSLHHSVTEWGNLQLRQVTACIKDGVVKDKIFSDPVTPLDPYNIEDWDRKSQEIVEAILTPEAKAEGRAAKEKTISAGRVESVTYDRVIDKDGRIAVRQITRIFDDGKEVSKKYHRSRIMPGDDLNGKDLISKAIAKKLHTPKVIACYKKKIEDRE